MTQQNSDSVQKENLTFKCLEIISRLYDSHTSVASLKAGLPIDEENITPEIIIRAAKKARLDALVAYEPFHQISPHMLPCLLVFKDGSSCVLLKINDSQTATIIHPNSESSKKQNISLQELENNYSGVCYFFRPLISFWQDDKSKHPLDWFWGTLKIFSSSYFQAIIASVFINLFLLISTLYALNVYDRVIPNHAEETLWTLSLGLALVYGIDFILRMLRSYFLDFANKGSDILLSSYLFEKLLGVRLEYKHPSSGELFYQLRDFESLREFFSSTTLVILADCPFIFLFLIVTFWIGSYIVLIPIIGIICIIFLAYAMQKPIRSAIFMLNRQMEKKYGLLTDSIVGIETVKSFNTEGQKQYQWEYCVENIAEIQKHVHFYSMLSMNCALIIQNLAYISIIILGVYMNFWGTMTLGGLIACSILTSRSLGPVMQLVGIITRFNQTTDSLRTLDKIINLPPERPEGTHFLSRPHFKGTITLQDIRFNYPGHKMPTLRSLSIHIQSGQKIGVLGRIGSGKSTIEKLLMGLYQPSSGFLMFDGTDSRQIDPSDIRNNIGYLPQDVFLFRGTIRENILMGKTVEIAALEKAAEISGVADFARLHPLGYDMPVGEGGSGLSGGQRQAVAIARAIINDPPILVFDEPSSAMDPASEHYLSIRLKNYIQNKTLIMITHRLPLLSLVDRLIIIEDGKITMDGPRDDVLTAINSGQIGEKKNEK